MRSFSKKVRDCIKQCLCDCPKLLFEPPQRLQRLQPLLYPLLLFLVAHYILCKIGPLDLNNAATSIAKVSTQGASVPLHLAAGSYLALVVVEMAVVVLAMYIILNLQRRCCWLFLWTVAFMTSLAAFYGFLHYCGECAVHPIKAVETILKYVTGPAQWHTAGLALYVLEFSSFAAISGLVTALCGLIWDASRASSGDAASIHRISKAFRWLKYEIAAGGIMMGMSVWNHWIWTSIPLSILPKESSVAKDYAGAVGELVAFYAIMDVLLLAVTVLPALFLVDHRARECACRCGYDPESKPGCDWMERNGLRFTRNDGIGSTFAILFPVVVQIATSLF